MDRRRDIQMQLIIMHFIDLDILINIKRDIQITKFERDVNKGFTGRVDSGLKEWTTDMDIEEEGKPIYDSSYIPSVMSYNFVNAFPVSIQDIQLSFGALHKF